MIFKMTDVPETAKDKKIAGHILKAHRRGQVRGNAAVDTVMAKKIMSESDHIRPVYGTEILRKYVAYSKRITPVMSEEATRIIEESYLETRKKGESKSAPVPMTARQLEAFIRLSEAAARSRLSPVVEKKDAVRAVDLVNYYLVNIAGDEGGIDIDRISTGTSKKQRDLVPLIVNIFKEYGADGLTMEEIVTHAEKVGISAPAAEELIEKMIKSNEVYCPKVGMYRYTGW